MDFRLVPFAVGAWLATAGVIVLGTRGSLLAVAVMLFACGFLVYAVQRKYAFNRVSVALFVIGAVMGSSLAVIRILPVTSGTIYRAATQGGVLRGTATVITDPITSQRSNHLDWGETQSVHVTLRINNATIHGHTVHDRVSVIAWASSPTMVAHVQNLQLGMTIEVLGRLRPGIPGRPEAAGLTLLEPPTVIQNSPRFQWFAHTLRLGLHRALQGYPESARGLVPGLALGDSSQLSPGLASDMKSAGLTHLIAVSGTNVTLLVIVTMSLLRRRRLTFATQFILVCAVLLAFIVVVRPQPSVLRAVVMGVIALSATFVHARRSVIPLLASAVLVLLVIDPWLAVSYGFALSVAATAGLLLWGNRVTLALDRILPSAIPKWLVDTLAVTLCAQLAVLPLLVALGSPLSLASIPANMVAVPLAGPAMVLGIVVAVVALVWPPGAQVLALCPALFAEVIALVAHAAAATHWLSIPWPSGLFGVVLAIVVVSTSVWTFLRWNEFNRDHQRVAATTAVTLLALLWIQPTASVSAWPPANWIMVTCDVGQGDGAVLNLGGHQGVVIDAGPDPNVMDHCLRKLRITSVPVLVLTHFHADHVGGIEGVFRNRHVGEVRVTGLGDPPATTRFVTMVLRSHHKVARIMTFPEHMKIGSLDIQCIWPAKYILGQGSDPNNASVVLLVHSRNTSILLTGDIEPAVQEAVMKSVTLGQVDVVKVPHHGSANQSPEFARWVGARQAVISVGANNDYGHPAAQTVLLYSGMDGQVWRTDQSGDIATVNTNGVTRVVAHGSSPLHGIVVLWQRTLQSIQHR